MKISVEPAQAYTFNVESGESESVAATRVEWQAKSKGKREHVNLIMESSRPQDMLRAAAGYFESLDVGEVT